MDNAPSTLNNPILETLLVLTEYRDLSASPRRPCYGKQMVADLASIPILEVSMASGNASNGILCHCGERLGIATV